MSKDLTRREALATLAFASVANDLSFAQDAKKRRIVILIDGTLNDEKIRPKDAPYIRGATNVALLSTPINSKVPLIPEYTSSGTRQIVKYFEGPVYGASGLDLRTSVKEAYEYIVHNYEEGDEIYLFGFSRGAYGVRALAGMINDQGIRKRQSSTPFETMWNLRENKRKMDVEVHKSREIACVGVWDTVSSFGAPGGWGLEIFGNLFSNYFLEGVHSTRLPENVKVALHAIAVDERRRSFIPMFWTAPGGIKPDTARFVEQAWFPGVHCDVGGGYRERELSDLALIWMIARVQEWTGLEFDVNSVREEVGLADIDGEVHNSLKNYIISRAYNYFEGFFHPSGRKILNKENTENNINEAVHWSVDLKYGRRCTIDGKPNIAYSPPYFSPAAAAGMVIRPSPKELELLPEKVTRLLASR